MSSLIQCVFKSDLQYFFFFVIKLKWSDSYLCRGKKKCGTFPGVQDSDVKESDTSGDFNERGINRVGECGL